ncbi:unnamed protein product [Brachionus calyciflorus]|uniref:Cyclin-like domain-containing protein n=1 Tax=Brachionus calyciflorus TaxID=104777 RepID=A0A814DYS6_9BILA|nr:unnamed protein product [Brachionus calyciflorus]
MGNSCCHLLKKSRYRSDEKTSVDQVGYKRTSLSSHANTNPIVYQSIPVQARHSVQTNQAYENKLDETNLSIPHIADFYPEEDNSTVPADNPRTSTLFLPKANIEKRKKMNESSYFNQKGTSESNLNVSKKFNSCSTIYIDDSTVSQPNLKAEIRLVACAIHYHIKRRTSNRTMDIFDEKLYPLSKDSAVTQEYDKNVPDQRVIYKFMKNLFTAAQLTAECSIVTLIYLERVLTYAEIDLCPSNWRRLLLGAILLASKVWDDQAVWNVDYCQILKDVNVDNMNELERQYLNLLQFNINVPSSVYAKYYFDLRTLAEDNNLSFPLEKLTKEKAYKLEALSSVCQEKYKDLIELQIKNMRRTASVDNLYSPSRKSLVILS